MQRISYYLFRTFLYFIYLHPFRLLYVFSDFLSFLMFYVVKYRKKVVINNLKRCFPEKSDAEILMLTRKFYTNFTDITLESLKAFTVSQKELVRRYKLDYPENINKFYHQGRSSICATGHYANWEWGTQAAPAQFLPKPIALYKPLRNKYIDDFIKKHRARLGTDMIAIENTRLAFGSKREKPVTYVMVGDQSPSSLKRAVWLNFLGQETACIHGIEAYSKLFDLPIIFYEAVRVKRGFYEIKSTVIVEEPKQYANGEITALYMGELEKAIRRRPENWLWSHRRWKHVRTQTGEVIKTKGD